MWSFISYDGLGFFIDMMISSRRQVDRIEWAAVMMDRGGGGLIWRDAHFFVF
jgi:hypothetical protein